MGDENKQNQEQESANLEKSADEMIDSLVDGLFAEDVEKGSGFDYPAEQGKASSKPSHSSAADVQMLADEGEQPKKASVEGEGSQGRPKEVHDVPNKDQDGNEAKGYDHIQSAQSSVPSSNAQGTVIKSESGKYEISEDEYELLQKAKKEREEEQLQKAREEQKSLVKAAVTEAVSELKEENEALKKSLSEMKGTIEKVAKAPMSRKSAPNVQAVEKTFEDAHQESLEKSSQQPQLSKADMFSAIEELAKSRLDADGNPDSALIESGIEFEQEGRVSNAEHRKLIEDKLREKGKIK